MDTIIINENFAYTNKTVIVKGISYPLSSIKEIGFSVLKTKLNNIPTGTSYSFTLILDNCESIQLNNSLGFFTNKKIAKLSHAYTFLTSETFNIRYNKYKQELNNKGYFEYNSGFSTCQFYANGNILKGKKCINIKKANKEGFIWYGTSRGIPGAHHYSTNPTQVTVSEIKRRYFSSKKISINFATNSDVMFYLLREIASD